MRKLSNRVFMRSIPMMTSLFNESPMRYANLCSEYVMPPATNKMIL